MEQAKRKRNEIEVATFQVENLIFTMRGRKIILDEDLARLYGVPTKRLNEQVRRNKNRFPSDFCFQLTAEELESIRSRNATASKRNIRYLPFAFTEHGALISPPESPKRRIGFHVEEAVSSYKAKRNK